LHTPHTFTHTHTQFFTHSLVFYYFWFIKAIERERMDVIELFIQNYDCVNAPSVDQMLWSAIEQYSFWHFSLFVRLMIETVDVMDSFADPMVSVYGEKQLNWVIRDYVCSAETIIMIIILFNFWQLFTFLTLFTLSVLLFVVSFSASCPSVYFIFSCYAASFMMIIRLKLSLNKNCIHLRSRDWGQFRPI
jgi:hypothetical protein